MSKIDNKPTSTPHAVKTIWGWQNSQTGELLTSAYGVFAGRVDIEVTTKPNQNAPIDGSGGTGGGGEIEPPPEPPVKPTLTITKQPVACNVVVGNDAVYTVDVDVKDPHEGFKVTYKWMVKKAGGTNWSIVSGQTTNTLTVKTTVADDGKEYKCIVDGVSPFHTLRETTDAVGLTVKWAKQQSVPDPFITENAGSQITLQVYYELINAGATDVINYAWYVKTADDADFVLVQDDPSGMWSDTAVTQLNGAKVRYEVKINEITTTFQPSADERTSELNIV